MEQLIYLDKFHQLLTTHVYHDILLVIRYKFLFLDIETVGLRYCEVLWQERFLFPFFVVLLYLFFSRDWVGVDLDLDTLIDVTKTDQVKSIVSFTIVECLLRFIGSPLYSFLNLIQVLLPLQILIFERIPIKQMPPETFTIIELVCLFKGYLIPTQIIISNIFGSFSLRCFHILISKPQRNIIDKGSHPLTNLRHIFVDIPPIYSFE